MGRILRGLGIGLGAATAVAVLLAAARIFLYRQADDPERVALKERYLERVGELSQGQGRRPSFVLIVFDDLGYGDLEAYGGRAIRTPNLDRLAAEGARLTDAYSASPYCSGSRAGLLTGRYALRSGLDHVLQPRWSWGDLLLRLGGRNRRLPAEEITVAEVLAAAGYATGIFGKWHLGDRSPSLPNDRGFEVFYGLLHSNDQGEPALWEDRRVAEVHPIDQATLTRRYTRRAIAFLEGSRDRPFFLYLPHTSPHLPLPAPAERRGESPGGLYGDVVEELDRSVGELMEALERLGRRGETLVVVTSDNGPWFQGSPGALRGRKLDIFEGGMRVPFLASWPGRIPPGRILAEPVMGIDLFPTILELAGLPLPGDRAVDGRSLAGLLERGEPPAREALCFFQLGVLRAVRSGRFKYHHRHRVYLGNPMDWPWGPTRLRGPWLFDLALDPSESYDASARHPEVVRRLAAVLEAKGREVEANPRGWR